MPVAWIHSEEQGTGKVRQPVRQDIEAKFSGAGGYTSCLSGMSLRVLYAERGCGCEASWA